MINLLTGYLDIGKGSQYFSFVERHTVQNIQ